VGVKVESWHHGRLRKINQSFLGKDNWKNNLKKIYSSVLSIIFTMNLERKTKSEFMCHKNGS